VKAKTWEIQSIRIEVKKIASNCSGARTTSASCETRASFFDLRYVAHSPKDFLQGQLRCSSGFQFICGFPPLIEFRLE